MKLLEKRKIDTQKAQERKQEIDTGLALAKSVDKLREARASEEKQLLEHRASMIKKVQYEIGQFIEERDNLEKQNNEAREIRDALLKPDIIQVKAELAKMVNSELERRGIFLSAEALKLVEKKLEEDKDKISQITSQVKQKEDETEKARSEAISLKELAQREYEMARAEHISQTDTHEKRLSELDQRKKEYEVVITTYELKKKEIEEKESELLLDRKHLESQQEALRVALGVIKQYAPST